MKSKGVILAVILVLGIGGVTLILKNLEHPPTKAAIGLEAPSFELKDTAGKLWRLSDLRGKVVLLNLWASWCGTCKEELPSIQNLINLEKDNSKLIFISVLYKDSPEKALNYLKARAIAFPVLIDTGNVADMYGITGVPETFVIDKKGTLKQRVVGPLQWDSPDVRAALSLLENE
ncbi:MAG TPA: TlpA disulfide reductase family protein [Dissulfurispiraceae bacterium]|nr:TlpA disulfide reductase family protein [Dissulfurispiraceae bacterium]